MTARVVGAVAALAAAAVAWAALPMGDASRGARPALIIAVVSAAASMGQLVVRMLAGRPVPADRQAELYLPPVIEAARRAWAGAVAFPWPQVMIVAVVALEALHPSRAWHTAILGVVLLGFLLVLHLAESGTGPSVLRRQLPLITAGVCLAVLSASAALLPATGAGSDWLVAIAAVAAVIAAGLALPV
jgi:hypothetical protein